MEKTFVLSSEILEAETPKNEKLGKIVIRNNNSTVYLRIFYTHGTILGEIVTKILIPLLCVSACRGAGG